MNHIIDEFSEPFAIMKHGLKGYGGEYSMWKQSNLTFLHIFARIHEEMKRVDKHKLGFYPYLLTTETVHTLDKLDNNENPIKIFFTPTQEEIGTWPEEVPDSNQIKWDCDDESKHTHLCHHNFGTLEIPCPIRIGDGTNEKYYALLIDNLEYFTWNQRLILDFGASNCVHISRRTPIGISLSGSLTFGVYKNCEDTSKTSRNYRIDVVASAILKPLYYVDVKP